MHPSRLPFPDRMQDSKLLVMHLLTHSSVPEGVGGATGAGGATGTTTTGVEPGLVLFLFSSLRLRLRVTVAVSSSLVTPRTLPAVTEDAERATEANRRTKDFLMNIIFEKKILFPFRLVLFQQSEMEHNETYDELVGAESVIVRCAKV